jgi:predicted GIY-YIG superfamily endonuclease
MSQFYVYIIYSVSADKYYVGYTTDIAKRLAEKKKNPLLDGSFLRITF